MCVESKGWCVCWSLKECVFVCMRVCKGITRGNLAKLCFQWSQQQNVRVLAVVTKKLRPQYQTLFFLEKLTYYNTKQETPQMSFIRQINCNTSIQ